MQKNNRRTGSYYEQAAAEYLKQKGLRILKQNYRCRYGEIDLIAQDGETIVFIEVKYRRTAGMGEPAEAVTAVKQKRIRDVASCYLACFCQEQEVMCRFDVITILGRQLCWIQDAF